MTPREAAAHFRSVPDRLRRELAAAEAESVAELVEHAEDLSSGPHSTAELRQMDHPLAKRHGYPRLDPTIINVQTGGFVSAWRGEGPAESGDGLSSRVFNVDRKARYLEQPDGGAKSPMFARHPHERAADETAAAREARLADAIERALTPE